MMVVYALLSMVREIKKRYEGGEIYKEREEEREIVRWEGREER